LQLTTALALFFLAQCPPSHQLGKKDKEEGDGLLQRWLKLYHHLAVESHIAPANSGDSEGEIASP
jgi:hypothetical protein